jgi:hypothetical protein
MKGLCWKFSALLAVAVYFKILSVVMMGRVMMTTMGCGCFGYRYDRVIFAVRCYEDAVQARPSTNDVREVSYHAFSTMLVWILKGNIIIPAMEFLGLKGLCPLELSFSCHRGGVRYRI